MMRPCWLPGVIIAVLVTLTPVGLAGDSAAVKYETVSHQSPSPAAPETDMPVLNTASQSGFNIFKHHYNICSNICSSYRSTSRNLALYMFEADTAWSLSLNEACFSDVTSLVNSSGRITGYGWVTTRSYVASCGGSFGNAVLTIGGFVDGFNHRYEDQHTGTGNCSISSAECRAMVCRKYSVFGIVTTSCSSHLQANNESLAFRQANAYAFFSTLFAQNVFRYLGGDLNLTPTQLPPVYNASYIDITHGLTYHTRQGLTKKIDYIHVQNTGWSYVDIRPAYCPTNASDHCYTAGTIGF